MIGMHVTTMEKKRALSNPAVTAHVLREVRGVLWDYRKWMGITRSTMEKLDAQLQSPPMYLYESGLFEVVAPAIGPEKAPSIGWEDLRVEIVHEQGSSDLNAGEIVWSNSDA